MSEVWLWVVESGVTVAGPTAVNDEASAVWPCDAPSGASRCACVSAGDPAVWPCDVEAGVTVPATWNVD